VFVKEKEVAVYSALMIERINTHHGTESRLGSYLFRSH